MGIRGLSGAGGRVGNAYDTTQSAGGSSSGSAAAVGTGYVPFALGSDNCGSLRLPAVYNGAVTLRATYGRFDTRGIFPIGFANGVPGVIARDTATLRAALAVAGDGWRADVAGDLRGRRIGIVRSFDRKDPWAPADAGTQKLFSQAIALMRNAGADIVEDVRLDDFDAKLGPGFLKGFAGKVDAAFATFPGTRRDWRDVCTSERIVRNGAPRNASRSPRRRRARSGKRWSRSPRTNARWLRLWTGCGSTRCFIPWTAAAARAATNRPTSPASSPAPPDCPQ